MLKEGERKMRVAICGLLTSQNLGELFIAYSLSYLIEREYKNKVSDKEQIEFVYVDISANNDEILPTKGPIERRIKNCYKYKKSGIPAEMLDFALRRAALKISGSKTKNRIHKIRHYLWNHLYNYGKRFNLYFNEKFQGVDAIVIDGAGLLEYSSNEYHEPLLQISEYGNKHGIPVVCNAIGRSGEYVPADYRCQILMKALRSESVKYVSARDSLETVQDCVGKKQKIKLLADAAFWSMEAFQVTPHPQKGKIGIGLIRGNSLLRYGVNFSEENWVKLFSDVGDELKKRGYDFFYFTNGMPADYRIGEIILERKKLGKECLVDRPTDAKELLNTISECEGIITCRMHSSIVSFSMGIPSVVFSWNQKVDKYMEIIGYPERAIQSENFDAKYAVDTLEKALIEGVEQEKIERMKMLAQQSVDDYLEIITPRK